MRRNNFMLIAFAAFLLVGTIGCGKKKAADKGASKEAAESAKKVSVKFSGGPSGGTYEVFTNSATGYLNDNVPEFKFFNQASDGSTENLRKVGGQKVHFGISYSGDVYLARNGRLPKDSTKYTNLRAISFLYKAPAQLVVLKDSPYKKVSDLKGKKVAIGGQGSGAAASGTRYFKTVGLWDNFSPQYLGYNKAASAIQDGKVDAMWILAGPPTAAIMQLSARRDIRLLDLYEYGVSKGLDKKHPYYNPLTIKVAALGDKYKGMDKDVSSFFDSALWITSKEVPEDIVYKTVKAIYAEAGLKYLSTAKKTFKQLQVKDGVLGVSIPLHKGAEKFWKEKGLSISDNIKAE